MLYKTCTENHSRWFSTKRSSDFFLFFFGCASSAWKWPWWVQMKVSKPCRIWLGHVFFHQKNWGFWDPQPSGSLAKTSVPWQPKINFHDWEKLYKQYMQPLSNHAIHVMMLEGQSRKKPLPDLQTVSMFKFCDSRKNENNFLPPSPGGLQLCL